MQKKSSTKTLIIITVIILAAILAYFYFSGSPTDTTSGLAGDSVTSDASIEATKVLTLLNQTSSLRIDPSLFKSAVYKSLVDHTVSVIEQPVGKPNPFVYSSAAPAAPATPATPSKKK